MTLHGLVDVGWPVLHDRALPNGNVNVDHLLVGPGGVFVLDAKMWTGHLHWDGEQLWDGDWPTGREMATARWETDQVIAALSPVLPDGGVPVRTVLVVHGSPMPLGAVTAYADGDPTRPVSIVSAAILSTWLDTRPRGVHRTAAGAAGHAGGPSPPGVHPAAPHPPAAT